MLSDNCIVSQVHIPAFDVQGSLTQAQKSEIVDLSLKQLRAYNPDSYIILTGHGGGLKESTRGVCDWVYWEDECRPLNSAGLVVNMPAQYEFVSIGLEHAREKGFRDVLKTRGDSMIGLHHAVDYCRAVIAKENKDILLTQQTGRGFIGDCLMFGSTQLLCDIWDANHTPHHPDGLVHTAKYFADCWPDEDKTDWFAFVRKVAAFRDVYKLKFSCLRWSYHRLCQEMGWGKVVESVMDGTFGFATNHWGRDPGWHAFDRQGNMTHNRPECWSEVEFYEAANS